MILLLIPSITTANSLKTNELLKITLSDPIIPIAIELLETLLFAK